MVVAGEKVNDSYIRFCDLLTLAEEYFAEGDLPAAVGLAQIAVRYIFQEKVFSHRLGWSYFCMR